MAVIDKFLGHRVTIPDNLRYSLKHGLWARLDKKAIFFGLSEPAIVLSGGVQELNFLTEEGETVEQNQCILFAITGKILYIDAPVQGVIHFNAEVRADTELINKDTYSRGWLFAITPRGHAGMTYENLQDSTAYMASLQSSEGFKNPEGLKGGVSGICRAVYSGIRMQKIHQET